MKLSSFQILRFRWLWFCAARCPRDHHEAVSISVAQNSHQGVAIDTFARRSKSAPPGATRSRPSTTAHWAASASPSRRCSWARRELIAFSSTGPVPNFVPEARILDILLFRDKAHARAVLTAPLARSCWTVRRKGLALAWAENGAAT